MTDDELLAHLIDDEERLVFERFTNDDAITLGLALVDAARSGDAAVAIDVRRGDQQLFHAALAGTSPDNDAWIDRKRRVVERFGHSSFYIGALCRSKGASLSEVFGVDEQRYAAHGGSFPIRVRDVGVVGSVTVSGLPQAEDHRLVVDVVERFVGST